MNRIFKPCNIQIVNNTKSKYITYTTKKHFNLKIFLQTTVDYLKYSKHTHTHLHGILNRRIQLS